MRERRGGWTCLLPVMLLSLFTGGCGGPAVPQESPGGSAPSTESASSIEGTSQVSMVVENQEYEAAPGPGGAAEADFTPYQAPEFADSAFHAEHAQGNGQVKLDLEHTSEGYIGVSGESDTRLKLQVADEFQPFLRPSAYVDYDQDSECVKLAAQLASKEEDALGVVGAVFEYICDNIVYDKEKAQTVQTTTGYMPVLDDTLRTGKGICFDYASLVAGMLRSQGIPTKMVFGDVSPDDIYHAWNMFYTEETGWVTVKYEVKAGSWNRLDLTFSANGADTSFIGDGANYLDEKYY